MSARRPKKPPRPAGSRAAAPGGTPGGAAAAAAGSPRAGGRTLPRGFWPALPLLGVLALVAASRGALHGTAVADDYTFLYHLRFHPLDFFDSMGAAFYWRPISRQVYFSLVGRWLLDAPVGAFVVNTLIVAALSFTLYRIARHGFSRPVAAAIASFPVLSEPARVLIGWPSGSQHLLASLFAALAAHEVFAGRRITAALAALAAVLSHELGVLVLVLFPLVAWSRTRSRRETLQWGAIAIGVQAVWAAGYAVAFRHGVELPTGAGRGHPIAELPGILMRTMKGALNLEDLPAIANDAAALHLILLGAALALLVRRAARQRLRGHLGLIGVALLCAVVGAVPLGLVEDWNSWRAWTPSLWFGFAATAFYGLVSPYLAGMFVVLRLATLLFAPTAPALVAPGVPESTSQMSFVRLARLQRTVESTRRRITAEVPRLRPRAEVRYWWIPRLAEFGFQGSYALRVWYRDTTLIWEKFGGAEGYDRDSDALVEYVHNTAWPAMMDEIEIVGLVRQARTLMEERRFAEADSVLLEALRIHRSAEGGLTASLYQNRARVAFNTRNYDRADSLNRLSMKLEPADPDPWTLAARIALVRNDTDVAKNAIRVCLSMNPGHAEGLSLGRMLKMVK